MEKQNPSTEESIKLKEAVKENKPLLNMNVSYDFKKAKELNNDVSGQASIQPSNQPSDQSSDDETELSTPETRPTLSNSSSN